jgi:hypothetical protein
MQTLVLIVSPLISVGSLAVTIYLFRQTQRANIMPVLVFSRTSAKRWQLANVGNGPALSIVVGDRAPNDNWGTPVRYFPISAGAVVDVDSLQHGDELVAVYTDIRGNFYSTVCTMSDNRFYPSNKFPKLKATVDEVTLRAMREEYRRKF